MARTILDILVSRNLLELAEATNIKKEAKERGVSSEDALYARGFTEKDVAEAKSELTGYPIKSLAGEKVPFEVLQDIPEESARHYKVIPLGQQDGYVDIGMLNPDDATAQEAVKFISARLNIPPRIFIITPSDLEQIINEYQNMSGEVTKALGEFKKEYDSLGGGVDIKRNEGVKITEDAPITKIVAVILRHATEGRASDIHIEPSRLQLRVRYRVDGELHTSLTLPMDTHPALITRIKVMTNLKIDETRIPQDGRFHAQVLKKELDFRVSTFPTSFGEKVVIRILDPSVGYKSFEELGIEGKNNESIQAAIKRPFGMVLVTGPTGSGKSTTLYAMLQILNQERTNVVSLEDPIEYYIEGVAQSQIRPEIGYTFAEGLRHILRQDPDIIMIGEIRDKETAQLAIHAALTGHLVLATLHTNNSIGVIPRLIDMGVDPYLIAPTLLLAVGQRLVRKLCMDSRKETPIPERIKKILTDEINIMPPGLQKQFKGKLPESLFSPEVSASCPKGTRGRMGIYEVLAMTPELERIILSTPSEEKIMEEAKRQGMITMKQDGIVKVFRGEIGLEQLLEVV